jgi:hypothetical protein
MLDEDFSSAAGPDCCARCLNCGASTQDIKATTTPSVVRLTKAELIASALRKVEQGDHSGG